jgi:glucose 1-dehydrogenase
VGLTGKFALVTGAAQGIGRGCALELARAGADVVINDLHRSPEVEAVAAEIRALRREAVVVEGDVFERLSCEQVAARAIEAFRRIDIFVSSPALNKRCDFLDYEPEQFERVVRATMFGGFHMSQLVAKHMVARGGRGKIVFICSVHSFTPTAESVAYNAGKAGLKNMAFTIAAELLKHRINVNVIDPGWIDTPGEVKYFGRETLDAEGPKQPWGRLGRPEDVGKAAAFLVSDDADYITGTALLVDGGQCLKDASKGESLLCAPQSREPA